MGELRGRTSDQTIVARVDDEQDAFPTSNPEQRNGLSPTIQDLSGLLPNLDPSLWFRRREKVGEREGVERPRGENEKAVERLEDVQVRDGGRLDDLTMSCRVKEEIGGSDSESKKRRGQESSEESERKDGHCESSRNPIEIPAVSPTTTYSRPSRSRKIKEIQVSEILTKRGEKGESDSLKTAPQRILEEPDPADGVGGLEGGIDVGEGRSEVEAR